MPRHRSRHRLPALLALAGLFAVGGLAACGEDQEEVQEILDRAFSEPIGSADATLNLDVQLEGSEQFPDPIRLQATGPYVSGEEGEPASFDFDVTVQGLGAEVPPIGLISVGDELFVELGGTAYAANDPAAERAGEEEEDASLGALGVEPREWIEDAEIEDEVDVGGVPTTHLSATVDVPALLSDLNEAAQTAPDVGSEPAPTLTDEELDQLAEVITEPRFDLFVGEDDGKVRRLTAGATLDPPDDAPELSEITRGSVVFSIEFANVGGDQTVEAPEDPRPLGDLFEQILGLGELLGDGGLPGLPPRGGGSGVGGAGGPGGGGAAGEAPAPGGGAGPAGIEPFVRYGRCLERADPGDQAALARCGDLLEP